MHGKGSGRHLPRRKSPNYDPAMFYASKLVVTIARKNWNLLDHSNYGRAIDLKRFSTHPEHTLNHILFNSIFLNQGLLEALGSTISFTV